MQDSLNDVSGTSTGSSSCFEPQPEQIQQVHQHQRVARKPAARDVRRLFDPRAFVPVRVNAQISKRYSIDAHELGVGGFGKVFVAEDKEVKGRKVAIKKIVATCKEKKAAFEKEVGLMKELDHPNICKILETYENGRVLWVVMEYCEGGEVFERIMDKGRLPEHEVAIIIKQVAGALTYAHSRGIAHRDLKPENVCFCEKDAANLSVKVIDWGVGYHFNQSGMSSAVGSTTYAAPEVLAASGESKYTAACDLWSLGVMTYVMLCGKPPFWGNMPDQLRKMNREQYPMQDSTWQGTSAGAKDFIRSVIRADPANRLTIRQAAAHPWLNLQSRVAKADGQVVEEVLSNMRQFSKTPHFFSICAASVAKQLDHKSLQEVQRVFSEMDENGDGVLELQEVKLGFEQIFGKNSEQYKGVEDMFSRLDLDGSGKIDYTEFCAAGIDMIGRKAGNEVEHEYAMRAAFKAFDVNDDNGRITRDEIMRVLEGVDVNKAWSREVCEQVAEEIFERFDADKDGSLDFEEWRRLMRESAYRRSGSGSMLEDLMEGAPVASMPISSVPSSSSRTAAGRGSASTEAGGPTLLQRRHFPSRLSSFSSGLKGSVVAKEATDTARETAPPKRSASRATRDPSRSGRNLLRKFTDMISLKKTDTRKATSSSISSSV
mmetsp:Transcript_131046/g.326935  ORF Transcript_131046/g.326935 Transcript_131046/m.326935 type:complete len:658 (-) Transcript_131046:287-2260(-)